MSQPVQTCPLGNLCAPPVACIVGIVVIIAVLYFVGKSKGWSCCGGASKAKKIIDEQYAEGKITKEEYEEKKKDLSC